MSVNALREGRHSIGWHTRRREYGALKLSLGHSKLNRRSFLRIFNEIQNKWNLWKFGMLSQAYLDDKMQFSVSEPIATCCGD